MGREEATQIELARAVETFRAFGHLLPQDAVAADDTGKSPGADPSPKSAIDDEQVIALAIERIDVASRKSRTGGRGCTLLLEKHLIAQALGPANVGTGASEANFEVADAAEHIWQPIGRTHDFASPGGSRPWSRQRRDGFRRIEPTRRDEGGADDRRDEGHARRLQWDASSLDPMRDTPVSGR
jgi:hypothetical protein